MKVRQSRQLPTASRLTKELTGGIKIEQRCVGGDLPLAGGKTKIPERYQEQMCGLPTSRLYIIAFSMDNAC